MTKLCIITVNLNNKKGLEKTFNSIINQIFTNFDLIVIDGGSTDGSLEIIKNNIDHISYWVSEKDEGIYNAMNKGIKQAKGEYCFFLNSGDYFINEFVLLNIFANNFNEDVIQGNMFVSLNNKIVGKCTGKEVITFFDIYSSIIKHQATFIKRSLFTSFGFYNEKLKIIADWEFFINSVGFGKATYKYTDIDISIFDNNGISNNCKDITTQERREVLNKLLPKLMQPDYEFMSSFKQYEVLTKNRYTTILIRLLSKYIKLYNSFSSKK